MRGALPFLSKLSAAPAICAATALFALMAMTFADVVLRSAFGAPIEAATELTRILMAVIVFSVLPVVSARGEHISVDLLDPYFPPWAARVRDGVMSLVCAAMLWLPIERIVVLAERARDYGDVTDTLNIPQFLVAWMIAGLTAITMIALFGRGLYILIWGHPNVTAE
ncbi:MAG: TRAP transporter small permease [Pseudomonadota bacterium]